MDKHKEIPLQRHTDEQEQVGEQKNDEIKSWNWWMLQKRNLEYRGL